MTYADMILRDGEIITLDPHHTVAEALAIKDGRVLETGSSSEVSRLAGPDTRVIDLDGRAVTPGFISTHDHFLEHGIAAEFVSDVRYPRAKNLRDIASIIAERVAKTEKGRWILAAGWDETLLEEHRLPNRFDLDPVSPENPVWIRRVFEMGVANSRALKEAGIDRDTPDPPLGKIDRDEDGEPTGILRGRAMDLVLRTIPPWTLEEREQAIRRACRDFLAQGITSVIEPGILMPQLQAYRSLHQKGELTVRIFVQYGFLHDVEEVREAIRRIKVGGDDMLRVIGLKFALDGGVGPRTALMYDPYEGQPENRGVQLIEGETLKEMTRVGHEAGFQVAIHAIGDRAIDIAVDAYRYAQESYPRSDPRHQIVHCYFPSEKTLRQIEELGVLVNTQTPFLYWLGDSFLEAIGPERCARCIPIKTLLQRGIAVGNSHDATVTPPKPPIGLNASVARKTIKGEKIGAEEAVTPLQALTTYTTLAARHAFMEDKIGSLEKGKYADIAVWNKNPLKVEPEGLKSLEVEMTLVEGVIRYSNKGGEKGA
ncbi:amidohydrolase [Candidatus Bathyarchaeota archaeon]|nr:MAG: amidohydrolase [Candidatus Bathyarchaeota archaeon]